MATLSSPSDRSSQPATSDAAPVLEAWSVAASVITPPGCGADSCHSCVTAAADPDGSVSCSDGRTAVAAVSLPLLGTTDTVLPWAAASSCWPATLHDATTHDGCCVRHVTLQEHQTAGDRRNQGDATWARPLLHGP